MFKPFTILYFILIKLQCGLAYTLPSNKFVCKKDISEHCRRRVVPSMFLASQVIGANAKILHFSPLDLPYSCFISVRTEVDNDIILVIEILSTESLLRSCSGSRSQLLVYDVDENFGGYWGDVPETLIKRKKDNTIRYYSLKTTDATDSTDDDTGSNDDNVKNENSEQNKNSIQNNDHKDYITVEVPIVNISGVVISGDSKDSMRNRFDIINLLDVLYDVAPRPEKAYETSLIPLVQFSVANATEAAEFSVSKSQQNVFTPDKRLMNNYKELISTKRRNKYKKLKNNSNKLLHFGNMHRTLFGTLQTRPFSERQKFNELKYFITKPRILKTKTKLSSVTSILSPLKAKSNLSSTNSWRLIEHLMSVLKNDSSNKSEQHKMSFMKDWNSLNLDNNKSVYLLPNLSLYNTVKIIPNLQVVTTLPIATYIDSKFLSQTEKTISLQFTKPMPPMNKTEIYNSVLNRESSFENMETTSAYSSEIYVPDIEDDTDIESNSSSNDSLFNHTGYKSTKPAVGSLVDHKSWENLVQVAPAIADVLNQTNQINTTVPSILKRDRRFIKLIDVENARPYVIKEKTVDVELTNMSNEDSYDTQSNQGYLEIADVENSGRLALRQLSHSLGALKLNICDSSESTSKLIYLFNSSKIVIAIDNFTMDYMTLVLTPARALSDMNSRCSNTQMECHVYGTRICIDTSSMCDGVPNCGSYDIYDEDRLLCRSTGFEHNMYLASFTLLAVLFTALYIVQYWIKKCVPSVSEAFFVYSNGEENMLLLKSVMRSPNEIDNDSKLVYLGHPEDDLMYDGDQDGNKKKKSCIRLLIDFFCCKYLRHKFKSIENSDIMVSGLSNDNMKAKKRFSFTEFEIRKMLGIPSVNTGVQTENGIALKDFQNTQFKKNDLKSLECSVSENLVLSDEYSFLDPDNFNCQVNDEELNVLKFFQASKPSTSKAHSVSSVNINSKFKKVLEEAELKCYEYDNLNQSLNDNSPTSSSFLSNAQVHEGSSERRSKHLRFQDSLSIISESTGLDENKIRRQHKLERSKRLSDLETIQENNESNENKDKTYFWKTKSKKKRRD
ncbi:uncharacterized protein LOC105842003 isoform X2 [Bombyx mori]|uniref:CUB domain-containing protein n=1 Tax=Bombyx mori TaxID=7091 RepID=A0A8R2M0Q7_BOMMO|nr:uncharacterized protein LOC105842003 isoform X3 [Bombyx mori]